MRTQLKTKQLEQLVTHFISILHGAGGRCYLIGGGVIDIIKDREVKDWDIEVFNLTIDQVKAALDSACVNYKETGKQFGVIKTKWLDYELDISIPRRENSIGVGHNDFCVRVDPTLKPYEAALRRDLTINSMYIDLHNFELVDYFGGKRDLDEGLLMCTDEDTFVEDPLRVLRVMQLLSRKGEYVALELVRLCRSMATQEIFDSLSKERVYEEFNKLLTMNGKPSLGLQFLVDCDWIKFFPELEEMVGCPQNPKHHPEGDVWEHTKRVVDQAHASLYQVPQKWQLPLMYGALLHDVGKPVALDPEDLTTRGHDNYGYHIAQEFMSKITNNHEVSNRACRIVREHMQPYFLSSGGAKDGAWRRLHNKVRLDVMAVMSWSDHMSRKGEELDFHQPSYLCREYFKKIGTAGKKIPAILQGRYLINREMKPGPDFKLILDRAYDIQIEYGYTNATLLYKTAIAELVMTGQLKKGKLS
jgi:tRNA nucleotidyltransferase (CCA-adding enzyme)